MAYIGLEQIKDYIEVKVARKAELEKELIKVDAEIAVANDFASLCSIDLTTEEAPEPCEVVEETTQQETIY